MGSAFRHRVLVLLSAALAILAAERACAQNFPSYEGDGRDADSSSFFIFVGDTQLRSLWGRDSWAENNHDAVRAIFDRIAAEHPGFLCILGDLTFEGWNPELWQRFDALAAPVLAAGIPVYPLFGNHEYLLDQPLFHNTTPQLLRREVEFQYFNRFPQLDNHLWYALRWRDVAIVMLNSNFLNLTYEEGEQQDRQYSDVLKRYDDDPSVRAVIVACHHPPYSNGKASPSDLEVREHFLEPFRHASKTVLFITGHAHSYQHFFIDGKQYIVSGGGGPKQELNLPAVTAPEQDLFHYPGLRPHHICRVEYQGSSLVLKMEMLGDDGATWSTGDTVTLLK